jgi:hypothetical protein
MADGRCTCTCGPFEDLGLIARPLCPYRSSDFFDISALKLK